MVDPVGAFAFSWAFVIAFVVGYLIGSLPTGLLITRLSGLGDIRKIGSGNIGATNVLRTGRKDLAALTLLGDFLKGAIPVWVGWRLGQDIAVLTGLGTVIGHCFPIWLKFRGGKAVATGAGAVIMLSWPVGLVAVAVWAVLAAIFRIASLAGICAAVAAPVAAWYLAYQPLGGRFYSDVQRFEAIAIIGVILILRHHANIRRLLAGKEPRFGASAPPDKS